MPVNLSVKNVPDALAEKLRSRAERNHRSLQRELMSILERATQDLGTQDLVASQGGAAGRDAGRITIEKLAERARTLFPKGSPSSVQIIRQQRDGRFGAEWARSGHHSTK
ncbi:MAG: Arc family DNA-binding protein [Burkholderiales bacterium]